MRFNTTIEHSQKRNAWDEAYAAHDKFARAGDDGTTFGGTTDADAASQAEHDALHAFLTHPATTPAELQDKIATMRQRGPLSMENLCWNEPDITAYLDGIERELMLMTRPSVSRELASAFDKWSEAHAIYWSRNDWSDKESDPLMKAEDAARDVLYEVPCTTPGDFIAKAYVELLDEYGAEGHGPSGLCFVVDSSAIGDGPDKTKLRDIMGSDLGCCMAALGSTDFDAGLWVAQTQRFGKHVSVTAHEGRRGLMLGMDGPHDDMQDILQRLTANGLRMVSTERCHAIADEIEANWPELVVGNRVLESA